MLIYLNCFDRSNLEFAGWLMGKQVKSCRNKSVIFKNFTSVELVVKTGRIPNLDTCFTFRDNFTTICVKNKSKEKAV